MRSRCYSSLIALAFEEGIPWLNGTVVFDKCKQWLSSLHDTGHQEGCGSRGEIRTVALTASSTDMSEAPPHDGVTGAMLVRTV